MKEKIKELVEKIKRAFKSKNDPEGSYTGNSRGDDGPSQDADDL